ncbi:outer membrane protein [Roseibium aquae]|uniref:Outer membrane protein n=1 Tax=Roseibium aquae TaxID=1323746 RepID=A0A916X2M3_9HYPH|nr:DsbA family protein [Roseibium aquae]GGB54481.1 outer membrane protein [Roseibium aquae]
MISIQSLCTPLKTALSGFLLAVAMLLPAQATADELTKSDVETIVREYLIANPDIIADALTELDRRQREAEEAARVQALTESADILFNSSRQAVLGNPNGDITLVEFFDYNCGYCKRAHGDMVRLIEDMPNLRVVLKEFPVLGQGSVEAAQIGIAVNAIAPDRYGEFHENLMLQRGQANRASAMKVATDMGLSEASLAEALATDEAGRTLEEVYTLANRLGLTGTPSYVVGDEVIMGAVGYEQLQAKLKSMDSCGETSC